VVGPDAAVGSLALCCVHFGETKEKFWGTQKVTGELKNNGELKSGSTLGVGTTISVYFESIHNVLNLARFALGSRLVQRIGYSRALL